MKLKDMTGDQLFDALLEIAEPIGNIASDQELFDIFKEQSIAFRRGKIVNAQLYGTLFSRIIPLAIKNHKTDVYKILAAVEGKKPSDMASMNGMELFRDAKDAWEEQLKPFFTLFAGGEKPAS